MFSSMMQELDSSCVFGQVYNNLLSSGELKTFSTLYCHESATDEQRTALGLKYLTELRIVPFKYLPKSISAKSLQASVKYRKVGNQYFMRDNGEALQFYTKSIASAPYPLSNEENSEELAVAFANRSAVYFVLEKYEACLKDIQEAVTFNYPDNLKYKLFEREAKCYQILGKKAKANASVQEAINFVKNAKHLPQDKMRETITRLKMLQQSTYQKRFESIDRTLASKPVPVLSFKKHQNIPSAAACIDVKLHPVMGRHIVATRNINPGDIIMVEEAFTAVLDPNQYMSYCNHCLKKTDGMIPCKTCNYAMFCSEECRENSWKAYHNIECHLVPVLNETDVGPFARLPLRLLLILFCKNEGLDGLYHLVKELTTPSDERKMNGFDESGKYLSTDYRQIHHLCRLSPRKINMYVQLQNVVTGAVLMKALKSYTKIFESEVVSDGKSLSKQEKEAFVGGLVLKYIELTTIPVSSHTVCLNSLDKPDVDDEPIGTGLFSASSLFNHSCDPNATVIFSGNVAIHAATTPIKKGEGVYVHYKGQHFSVKEFAVRQRAFRDHFECKCAACTNIWPTMTGLEELESYAFFCDNCHSPLPETDEFVTCTVCEKNHKITEYVEKVHDIMLKMIKKPDPDQSKCSLLKSYSDSVKNINQFVQRPNTLIVKMEQMLKLCLKMDDKRLG